MRKMKRGQWIAAVFGLALAGTLTFGVTYDAQAAGRSLIAGEWINMRVDQVLPSGKMKMEQLWNSQE